MIVRHLHKVNELLSVLTQSTVEMATLRNRLREQGRFPSRRTWERRLKAIPSTLLAQLGCLGQHLIDLIQPWASCGRAVAIDSTVLREFCEQADRLLVATQYGSYPHTDDGVDVRRIFHKLRSVASENCNEHFKGIFDAHGQVPDLWLVSTPTFCVRRNFCLSTCSPLSV